jgi:hypothetical protein
MSETAAPRRQDLVALRPPKPTRPKEESQSAWASEEPVPLRVAAKRAEAEERVARLRVVTGLRQCC